MSVLARLIGGASAPQAAVSADDVRKMIEAGLIGGPSSAGVHVSPESAMRCAAVFDCVRVISEDVAKLPLILYRRLKGGGKSRAWDHPLYRLLHDRPNPWMTALNFREGATAHLCLRGNGYAYVNRVGAGRSRRVAELLPLHPDRLKVTRNEEWEVSYSYRRRDGQAVQLRNDEVLHLCGMSLDGLTGVSPITYMRESVGLSLAAERFGALLFSNGARMSGILKHPGKLKDEAVARRIRESFDEATSGDNVHRTALLEDGLDWVKVSMSSDDAQFLETRKFQRSEIAGIFRVPPHKIGDLEKATFSNIEQQAIEYVTDCLMSYLVRWEQTLNESLLTEEERGVFFFEHLVDALLRGDLKSRYEAYASAINAGWMNRNEARVRENMNPVEGLGEFLRPLNMDKGTGGKPAGGEDEG